MNANASQCLDFFTHSFWLFVNVLPIYFNTTVLLFNAQLSKPFPSSFNVWVDPISWTSRPKKYWWDLIISFVTAGTKTCMPEPGFYCTCEASSLFSVCMHPKDHYYTKVILPYFLRSIPRLNKTNLIVDWTWENWFVSCRISLPRRAHWELSILCIPHLLIQQNIIVICHIAFK